MTVTPFTAIDIHQLVSLQPADWPDIQPSFRFYSSVDFCHPFKLITAEITVAVGVVIIHNDVAWLAHIIVHPQFRRKGLGKKMTQYLVDTAYQKGCSSIYLLATQLGEAVYAKLGFVTETAYLAFTGVTLATGPSSQLQPYDNRFQQQLAILDKDYSSEDRFFHLKQHLDTAFIYVTNDILEGYYLPGWGSGLIVAVTAEAGLALTALHTQQQQLLFFPEENLALANTLQSLGYTPVKKLNRMRLGAERPLQLSYVYNRIGGNLG